MEIIRRLFLLLVSSYHSQAALSIGGRRRKRLFFVYAAHFLRPPCGGLAPLSPLTPDGTSFNIQNPIPHPSQKEKGLLETRRAQECQRGIAGAAERAKEGGRVPSESSDTRLGARCWKSESLHLFPFSFYQVFWVEILFYFTSYGLLLLVRPRI